MMKPNRDHEYLGKLQDYYAQHRVLPSYAAVARLLGLKAISAVAKMVDRMKAEGFLDSTPDKRLQPGKRFFERELADTIRAGLAAAANDALAEPLRIDDTLIRVPSRTVLLTVKGDSMIEAGLMPGDTIIVLKGTPAKVGDIVVAIVDNEFTVKYLDTDKHGQFFLRPGNKAYPAIHPHEALEVFGRVEGAYRVYPH